MKFNISNFVCMNYTCFSRSLIKVNQRQEITKEYTQGMTLAEIGVIHGISRQRVHQLLKVMGVTLRTQKRSGDEIIYKN